MTALLLDGVGGYRMIKHLGKDERGCQEGKNREDDDNHVSLNHTQGLKEYGEDPQGNKAGQLNKYVATSEATV